MDDPKTILDEAQDSRFETDSKDATKDRTYTASMSRRSFCYTLQKRAIKESKSKNIISQLDSAVCVYLIDYLVNQKFSSKQFVGELTGIFTRALDDLSVAQTDAAKRFIKRYNELGDTAFKNDWEPVKNLRFTHVDAPDYRLNIVYVLKCISHDIFGDFRPVDFTVLESEQKVLALHFQRFLNRVWEKDKAKSKCITMETNNCLTGVFGRVRFTTWETKKHLIFELCYIEDEFYAFRFVASPRDTRSGYSAELFNCQVDLVSALLMLEEVIKLFDLNNFQESNRSQHFFLPKEPSCFLD